MVYGYKGYEFETFKINLLFSTDIYIKKYIMKKVIRLTENNLIKIVKKVISEQKSEQNNNKILEQFLLRINTGGKHYYSYWVLDPTNPDKRGGSVQLTGKEATIKTMFVNKPLVWSLMVDKRKISGSIFEIFKFKGKLYYTCITTTGWNRLSVIYEELAPNLNSAIDQFNQNVSMQNTN